MALYLHRRKKKREWETESQNTMTEKKRKLEDINEQKKKDLVEQDDIDDSLLPKSFDIKECEAQLSHGTKKVLLYIRENMGSSYYEIDTQQFARVVSARQCAAMLTRKGRICVASKVQAALQPYLPEESETSCHLWKASDYDLIFFWTGLDF
jgi:hypothetical protein